MVKKITLFPVPKEKHYAYEMGISFDQVYEILSEDNVHIGIVYLSEIDDENIYIEWIEIMTPFHGQGNLRATFHALWNLTGGKTIRFECDDKLRKKYIGIGATMEGFNDLTENYSMKYIS